MTLLRPRAHAERLVPMTAEMLRRTGLTFEDIDAIAVSSGPGSYTGLRIGVSTAKGFARAYGAQLIGVSTLQCYARAILTSTELPPGRHTVAAVALKARKSEIYFAAYSTSSEDGLPETVIEPCLVEISDAVDLLARLPQSNHAVAGGDAAANLAQSHELPVVTFLPVATHVVEIGRRLLDDGRRDDLVTFEPYYLKDYFAEKRRRSVFEKLPF